MTMRIVLTISALATSVLCQPACFAQTAEQFYATHSVTLVSSFAAGGFNDLAARLVARHLGRFISGTPNVIVQNMPGGGGIIAANHLYNVAARDGSVVGELDRGIPQAGFRGAPNIKFDVLNFTWLGSLSTYANEACILWVNSNHPVRTVTDLGNSGVHTRLGTITGATDHLLSLISKKVLKLNVEVIAGYPGAGAIWLGMQNGELDGQIIGTSSVEASHADLLRNHALRALVQFGRETRLAGYADVPTGRELAADPTSRSLVEFSELPFLTSLPFVAPPDLPSDRADVLRTAFEHMFADPAFVAEAAKLHVAISPIGGAALLVVLRRYAATPKNVISSYNEIIDAGQ